jgi:hypothetical protein
MALDVSLIKHTLDVLSIYDGRPAPEDTLASDVELKAARPLTTMQISLALTWLSDQGYAESRQNALRQTVWTITERGRSASIGM